jgi:hypothetical protein
MKSCKKKNLLLAVVTAGMVAGSANAQTALNIATDTAYRGNVSFAGFGPVDAYLTAFQATYAGGDPLPFPTTNPFNTFCVDISPDLIANGGTWTAGTFPLGANGNAIQYVPNGIQSAAGIYNTFVGNADISTASGQLWGAALQLAIWTDLYGPTFSLTADGSGSDIGSVQSLAHSILTSIYNVPNPSLTSTFWNATDPANNQDLIGPQMETGFVPEPGLFTAAASGCAFLGLLGFRRKRALS